MVSWCLLNAPWLTINNDMTDFANTLTVPPAVHIPQPVGSPTMLEYVGMYIYLLGWLILTHSHSHCLWSVPMFQIGTSRHGIDSTVRQWTTSGEHFARSGPIWTNHSSTFDCQEWFMMAKGAWWSKMVHSRVLDCFSRTLLMVHLELYCGAVSFEAAPWCKCSDLTIIAYSYLSTSD